MRGLVSQLVLLTVVAAGCTQLEGPHGSADPVAPSLELLDDRQVMDERRVNVHVNGTFQVFAGNPPRILGTGGRPEPANFPGHPPLGPGSCIDGLWFNARGHATSGSLDQPHPHCYDPGEAMTIVLEPISSELISEPERGRSTLVLSELNDLYLHFERSPTQCDPRLLIQCFVQGGTGFVVAYAVDAATGQRVGVIAFDLALKLDPSQDPFACSLDGDSSQNGCINYIYRADYKPLPPEEGGRGEFQSGITGFLYWFTAE